METLRGATRPAHLLCRDILVGSSEVPPSADRPKIWAEGEQRPPFSFRGLRRATISLARDAVAPLNAWAARVPLPLLAIPVAAIVAGRAILADRESKKRDIEMEIFAAQQRREEAVAESNNLVVVRFGARLLLDGFCFGSVDGVILTTHCFVAFFFFSLWTDVGRSRSCITRRCVTGDYRRTYGALK